MEQFVGIEEPQGSGSGGSGPGGTNPHQSTLNPFIGIWIQPRGTIRQIVDSDPDKYVYALAAVAGIQQLLDTMVDNTLGDQFSLVTILLIGVIGGAIAGIISLLIGGKLLYLAGSAVGGTGVEEHVRTAIAWSSVPDIVLLAIYSVIILIYGRDWFTSSTDWLDNAGFLTTAFIFGVGFLALVITIWRFFIYIKTLAEVQNISAWRSLASLLLIVVPIFLLVFGCARLGGG